MSEEKKKVKEVVALTYKQNLENAPTVIAKGKGVIAENLIKIAQEHQILIQEDPSLVALLGQLDINESIPEELYQAVAEVFAFIYRIDQSHGLKR
ncbi:EscU/YscU/HrcU family type III secretion system export apparatus switch protein [Paenisporosarcina sp.]|uniref:EscU/YscU/HrcU family type III secretion system export apparatus switch protein n=1 Tax=Paenisporosarcina sp. TaxID=1932001 RepID=UPI003C755719